MGLLVAACSGSTKKSGAQGGSGEGGTTSAAGSAGSGATSNSGQEGGADGNDAAGSGGNASTAGSSASAGAAGSAGAPTIHGMPGAQHPDCGADCGGSPVGGWVYTGTKTSCSLIPYSGDPPEPEECTVFLLPNSTPGEPPVKVGRAPRFDYSELPLETAVLALREDGSFSFVAFYKGTGHLQLAAQCRKLGENIVACSDVAAVVEPSLLGEGTGRNLTCIDNTEGGCDCSFEVNEALGPSGVWRTTPEGKLLLLSSAFQPEPVPAMPPTLPATYCAGETLALGPELRIPGQPATGEPMVFERVDCTDGIKGPGEQGIDCGLACSDCLEPTQ